MWKIGNIKIDNKIVLAPMAGVTNHAFRKIVKEIGAGLVYSEMISTKGIFYNSKKTLDLLKIDDFERPISIQIFGSDIESFKKAAVYIDKNIHPDIIDINMGCPVPKVAVKSQAGSALLKDPQKIYKIVKEVVENVSVPVTVKIRSGWDNNSINAVEVAMQIEKAGASAITIHPRTRSQGYSGHSDWNIIKQVKENVNIPVIGNGDIKTIYDAKEMLETTKCDAIMIGRASLGNPWFINECVEYIENNKVIPSVTSKEKLEMILKHYKVLKDESNESHALLEMRTHALLYLKGIPDVKKIKNEIIKVNTEKELLNILETAEIKMKNI